MPWFFWLFPIAFAIHNVEEAIWLPAWSKSAGRFHKPVGAFELIFALIVLTMLSLVFTAAFYLGGCRSAGAYLFFAFNLGMLVNVLFPHLAATIALKRYCPGLLTGVVVLSPTTVSVLLSGYARGCFSAPTLCLVTIPVAGVLVGSIPLLFRIGRFLQTVLRGKGRVTA